MLLIICNYCKIHYFIMLYKIKIFYNSSNLVNFPMDSGMVPLKLLVDKSLFNLNSKKYY